MLYSLKKKNDHLQQATQTIVKHIFKKPTFTHIIGITQSKLFVSKSFQTLK